MKKMTVSLCAAVTVAVGGVLADSIGDIGNVRLKGGLGKRLDAVIARVWNLSRTQSQDLCREGKVFVNGRQRQNGSQDLKPEDRISVRGFGKFIYAGEENVTGKGRFRVLIRLFV